MSSLTPSLAKPALPRLLIADDHHLILDALGTILRNDFEVLAVDNRQRFLEAVDEFHPDVAVLDVSMPGGDGFSTAKTVLQKQPELPIVFLSMHNEPEYVEQAAHLGAKAYLSKHAPAQDLLTALHSVLEGHSLLPDTTAESSSRSGGRSDLTTRQREVLKLIAAGCSAKDIANQLNISVRTAEFHRAAIMQRLGLRSTAQMTRYAIMNDLG